MPADADADATLPLPGLSPVGGKPIIARFDGGSLSSDGGLLALREVEARLGVARRLAGCIDDARAPERIRHGLAEMLRFRLLMIAAGYEDEHDGTRRFGGFGGRALPQVALGPCLLFWRFRHRA
jgi:hypothetical protein